MNTNEAISIKEKLEEVLIVIDEYGKQAKQFSETRDNLTELIKKLTIANDTFADSVINVDEFLSSAKQLIEIDYISQIKEKIIEVSEIEEFHKTQCDDTLTRISDLAASFESNANMLVANQDALQEKIRSLHEMLEKHFEAEESKKNEVLGRLGNLSENIEKRFNTIEKMISDNVASEKDFHPQEHPDLQFEGVEDR